MSTYKNLAALPTPCLLLDNKIMQANIKRMGSHIRHLGANLRPHVKTNKSINITRAIIGESGLAAITVSTIKEAQYFFEHGINDILYAVGMVPSKAKEAAELIKKGCDLKVILDSPEMAQAIAGAGDTLGVTFNVLIELDVDGHRSGVLPESSELLDIAKILDGAANTKLLGVMSHAGASYECTTAQAALAMAHQERDLSLRARDRLIEAGFTCDIVSIGSTPSALSADDLTGITEVRAGAYVFFDLTFMHLGICEWSDIAISALCTVIGHQKDKNIAITDGGWQALSSDIGDGNLAEHGYGLVMNIEGKPIENLIVSGLNQEHGIISTLDETINITNVLPIGSQVRIFPNHACATAAQYDEYYVLNEENIEIWSRINRW